MAELNVDKMAKSIAERAIQELKDNGVFVARWIPVSEGLPEKDGEYLLYGKVIEDEENYIFIGDYDSCAEAFGYWQDYYDPSTLGYVDGELLEYASVIAWMPLPERYKEGEDE